MNHFIWIIPLAVVTASYLFFLITGYFLFKFLCTPKRSASASLDGNSGRSLQKYVPVIKQNALAINAHKHEMVKTTAFDGITLRAKLYPNTRKDRFVILAHGYQSSPSWDFGASFDAYYDEGYSILALEMRGHGSEGKYIGFGALDQKDVHQWMLYLADRFGKDIRIALAGVSMGAATVMLTSGNYPTGQLAAVIEDCGYDAADKLFHYLIRSRKVPPFTLIAFASMWSGLLAGYFFRDAKPVEALRKSHTPTLFIHGTADTFVPFDCMEANYNACAAPKEKAVFEGAIHGESSYREPERYRKVVQTFLRKYMA